MSDQERIASEEKIASENSPVESRHSSSSEDLSDVSASESELVGDDTKSLIFRKTLMDESELDWMVTNRMVERAVFDCLRVKQLLNMNLMNVLSFRINFLLVFACLVKTLLNRGI